MKELALSEGFDEDIRNFLGSQKIAKVDDMTMDELPNVVHVDLNVFGQLMMDQILWDLNGTLVVTKYDWWPFDLDTKLSEKMLKPNGLSGSIHNPSILNLR